MKKILFVAICFFPILAYAQEIISGPSLGSDKETRIYFAGNDANQIYLVNMQTVNKQTTATLEAFDRSSLERIFRKPIIPEAQGKERVQFEHAFSSAPGCAVFYSVYDSKLNQNELYYLMIDATGTVIQNGMHVMSIGKVQKEKEDVGGKFVFTSNPSGNSLLITGERHRLLQNSGICDPKIQIRIFNSNFDIVTNKEVTFDFQTGEVLNRFIDEQYNLHLVVQLMNKLGMNKEKVYNYLANGTGTVQSGPLMSRIEYQDKTYAPGKNFGFYESPTGDISLFGIISKSGSDNLDRGLYMAVLKNGKPSNEQICVWPLDQGKKKPKEKSVLYMTIGDIRMIGNEWRILAPCKYEYSNGYNNFNVMSELYEIFVSEDFRNVKMTELRRRMSVDKFQLADYSWEIILSKEDANYVVYNEKPLAIKSGELTKIENLYEEVVPTLAVFDGAGKVVRKEIPVQINGDKSVPIQCARFLRLDEDEIVTIGSAKGQLHCVKMRGLTAMN